MNIQEVVKPIVVSRNKRSWRYIKRYYPVYRCKNEYFASLVLPHLNEDTELLDLGCGRGLETTLDYSAICKTSYGVDPTDAVFQNRTVERHLLGSSDAIPLPDQSVNVVVSQQVLEHLEAPERAFAEVKRVLKPGGRFFAMTPNLWYPTTLVARCTPYSFHVAAAKMLFGIDGDDTFPTHYKANRASTLRRLGEASGLTLERHEYFACNPGQFAFSPLLTRLEVAYMRLISNTSVLSKFRDVVIVQYRKPLHRS